MLRSTPRTPPTSPTNLETTPPADFYELREATTMTELFAILRLRASVFGESRYRNAFDIGPGGLELDAYDPRAKHFGLFLNGTTPVGYERLVFGDAGIVEPRIHRIAEECPELEERIAQPVQAPLPMFGYCPFPEALSAYYWSRRSQEPFVEGSRFSVVRERRHARAGLKIIEGCMAITYLVTESTGITACRRSLAKVYERYGARYIPGTRPIHSDVWGEEMSCMKLETRDLAEDVRARLEPIADEYRRTGMIRFAGRPAACDEDRHLRGAAVGSMS